MKANAKLLKANYMKEYRAKNKDRINSNRKEWNKKNSDKVKRYQENYWNRKAEALKGSET